MQYQPIFYTKREEGVTLRADSVDWERRDRTFTAFRSTTAIVYGRAKLPEEGYETTLGMLVAVVGGVLGPAKPEHVDELEIKRCLGQA